MGDVFKRNNTLEEFMKHWNHDNTSNIGLGKINRKFDEKSNKYLHTKTNKHYREDLKLFNLTIDNNFTINGYKYQNQDKEQIQFPMEPFNIINFKTKTDYRFKRIHNPAISIELLNLVTKWFDENFDEICRQIHYLTWFRNQTIVDMDRESLIKLLESYQYEADYGNALGTVFRNTSLGLI